MHSPFQTMATRFAPSKLRTSFRRSSAASSSRDSYSSTSTVSSPASTINSIIFRQPSVVNLEEERRSFGIHSSRQGSKQPSVHSSKSPSIHDPVKPLGQGLEHSTKHPPAQGSKNGSEQLSIHDPEHPSKHSPVPGSGYPLGPPSVHGSVHPPVHDSVHGSSKDAAKNVGDKPTTDGDQRIPGAYWWAMGGDFRRQPPTWDNFKRMAGERKGKGDPIGDAVKGWLSDKKSKN
ncbi:Fc.00g070080.m01.CDS01 [Cosmosporella sp. VM-42]